VKNHRCRYQHSLSKPEAPSDAGRAKPIAGQLWGTCSSSLCHLALDYSHMKGRFASRGRETPETPLWLAECYRRFDLLKRSGLHLSSWVGDNSRSVGKRLSERVLLNGAVAPVKYINNHTYEAKTVRLSCKCADELAIFFARVPLTSPTCESFGRRNRVVIIKLFMKWAKNIIISMFRYKHYMLLFCVGIPIKQFPFLITGT